MKNLTAHLWEIEHDYCCSESNYFSRNHTYPYSSWEEFLKENGRYDLDLNLLFRWDWVIPSEDNEVLENEILWLFVMQQRKGLFVVYQISVKRKDEESVKAYLRPRWEKMKSLWGGISC